MYHQQQRRGYGHVTVLKFCRLSRCSASRGFVSNSWATCFFGFCISVLCLSISRFVSDGVRVCVCYRAWLTAGPCLTAAASDVDDDAVSCVHLEDSADRCKRLADLASVHDDDLTQQKTNTPFSLLHSLLTCLNYYQPEATSSMFHVTVARSLAVGSDGLERTARKHQRYGSVNLLFQTLSEDSSFLLLLAHERIKGFAFMRYINPRLTLTYDGHVTHSKQHTKLHQGYA